MSALSSDVILEIPSKVQAIFAIEQGQAAANSTASNQKLHRSFKAAMVIVQEDCIVVCNAENGQLYCYFDFGLKTGYGSIIDCVHLAFVRCLLVAFEDSSLVLVPLECTNVQDCCRVKWSIQPRKLYSLNSGRSVVVYCDDGEAYQFSVTNDTSIPVPLQSASAAGAAAVGAEVVTTERSHKRGATARVGANKQPSPAAAAAAATAIPHIMFSCSSTWLAAAHGNSSHAAAAVSTRAVAAQGAGKESGKKRKQRNKTPAVADAHEPVDFVQAIDGKVLTVWRLHSVTQSSSVFLEGACVQLNKIEVRLPISNEGLAAQESLVSILCHEQTNCISLLFASDETTSGRWMKFGINGISEGEVQVVFERNIDSARPLYGVHKMLASSSSSVVFMVCDDGAVAVWDARYGTLLHELRTEPERGRNTLADSWLVTLPCWSNNSGGGYGAAGSFVDIISANPMTNAGSGAKGPFNICRSHVVTARGGAGGVGESGVGSVRFMLPSRYCLSDSIGKLPAAASNKNDSMDTVRATAEAATAAAEAAVSTKASKSSYTGDGNNAIFPPNSVFSIMPVAEQHMLQQAVNSYQVMLQQEQELLLSDSMTASERFMKRRRRFRSQIASALVDKALQCFSLVLKSEIVTPSSRDVITAGAAKTSGNKNHRHTAGSSKESSQQVGSDIELVCSSDWEVAKMLLRSGAVAVNNNTDAQSLLFRCLREGRFDVVASIIEFAEDLTEKTCVRMLLAALTTSDDYLDRHYIVDGNLHHQNDSSPAGNIDNNIDNNIGKNGESAKKRKKSKQPTCTSSSGDNNCMTVTAEMHVVSEYEKPVQRINVVRALLEASMRRNAKFSSVLLGEAVSQVLPPNAAVLLLRVTVNMLQGMCTASAFSNSAPITAVNTLNPPSSSPSSLSKTRNNIHPLHVHLHPNFTDEELAHAISWTESLLDGHFSALALNALRDGACRRALMLAIQAVEGADVAAEGVECVLGQWTHMQRVLFHGSKQAKPLVGIYQVEQISL